MKAVKVKAVKVKTTLKKGQQGFTLIEILIAIVILSFVSIGIVTVTDNSVTTRDSVIKEDRGVLQVETVLSRIEDDLSHLYTPLFFSAKAPAAPLEEEAFSRYEGSERFAFVTDLGHPVPIFHNPDKQTFAFMIFNNKRRIQDSKQSNFAWIRYYIRQNADKSRNNNQTDDSAAITDSEGKKIEVFELVRNSSAEDIFNLSKVAWENSKSQTVLSNLTEFEFQFWNDKKKKFVETLDDIEGGRHLVRAVKVKFTWVGNNGVQSKEEKIIRNVWPYFKEVPKENNGKKSSGGGGIGGNLGTIGGSIEDNPGMGEWENGDGNKPQNNSSSSSTSSSTSTEDDYDKE